MLSYGKRLKALSQRLRKNMTDAEKRLWLKLRRKQLKGHPFYRQKIIGKYIVDTFDGAKPRFLNRGKKRRSVSTLSIPRASDRGVEWVDFYSPKANLVIELDGGQHYSEAGKARDRTRDDVLSEMGIRSEVFRQGCLLEYWRSDGRDMELLMIYKISPNPVE